MRRFFYHYNKPASISQGCTMWTVHYKGICHIVTDIDCTVPTQTKSNVRQPRAVVVGKCEDVIVKNGKATIV